MPDEKWEEDWRKQSQDGVYDGTDFASDLFIMVPPHRFKRHILLIHANQEPTIELLDANIFLNNEVPDSNPFILAHTHNHYQSMVPLPGSEEFWRKIVDQELEKNKRSAVPSNINKNESDTGSKINCDAIKSTVKDTIDQDLNENNKRKEIEENREVETLEDFQVVGKRKKDDEGIEIGGEWKVVGKRKKSGKLFPSSITTRKSTNKRSVDRCEVCNRDFKIIEEHLKKSENCRKNNKAVGPTENKSTNKNRKKVKVQQKESKKDECSDDDFLPSGNKLPKSGQKQLPKSPPAAQVSPATKKASQDKPNTSEQQKYPEFVPTSEF